MFVARKEHLPAFRVFAVIFVSPSPEAVRGFVQDLNAVIVNADMLHQRVLPVENILSYRFECLFPSRCRVKVDRDEYHRC